MMLDQRTGSQDCHWRQGWRVAIPCVALLSVLSLFVYSPSAARGGIAASAQTTVTPTADGNFQYDYTITNTSDTEGPNLIVWGMPFFDSAANSFVGGDSAIVAPAGWTFLFAELTPSDPASQELWSYVAADDPKNASYGAPGSAFDNPPDALVFFIDPFASPLASITPGQSLGGFSYISQFAGTDRKSVV